MQFDGQVSKTPDCKHSDHADHAHEDGHIAQIVRHPVVDRAYCLNDQVAFIWHCTVRREFCIVDNDDAIFVICLLLRFRQELIVMDV